MRVLLVEDDVMLGKALQAGLEQDGHGVDWLRLGEPAFNALRENHYDAAVLDLNLPDVDGIEVLHRARRAGVECPILILTARHDVRDRVAGLDAGADDYLVKPIDLDELAARIRAHARRAQGEARPVITLRNVEIDLARHRVRQEGKDVDVSAREFSVLLALARNRGRVLTRSQLEDALYAWGEGADSNVLEVLIYRLRRKLGNELIRTVRGTGYMIDDAPADSLA